MKNYKVTITEKEKRKKYVLRWRDYARPDKRKMFETVYGTKRDASNRAAEIIEAIKTRLKAAQDGYIEISLSDFLHNEYLPYLLSTQAQKTQYDHIRNHLVNFLMKHVGPNILLSSIGQSHIDRFKAYRLKSVRPETVRKGIVFIKKMLKLAVQWKFARTNPATDVEMPSVDNSRIRWLRDYEINTLLDSCGNERVKNIINFAIATGMRAGEIKNLRWDDIVIIDQVRGDYKDWTDEASNLAYKIGYIAVTKTKNKMNRKIPINLPIHEILSGLNRVNEYVFEGIGFRESFEYARKKAGLNDVTFHDLRHTFATRAIHNGIEIQQLKELLGHKTLAMTLRYAHVSGRLLQGAMDKMERASEKDIIRTQEPDKNREGVEHHA